VRDCGPAKVRLGSWLCENSSARRARRNISKKLRVMESNDAARAMFDTLLENCIFYISPMYEFLHSQGQILTPVRRAHVSFRRMRTSPSSPAAPLQEEEKRFGVVSTSMSSSVVVR
jgi:hypothetical protein